jgi:hypothetical protein
LIEFNTVELLSNSTIFHEYTDHNPNFQKTHALVSSRGVHPEGGTSKAEKDGNVVHAHEHSDERDSLLTVQQCESEKEADKRLLSSPEHNTVNPVATDVRPPDWQKCTGRAFLRYGFRRQVPSIGKGFDKK